ncbi:uncharacterized protein G2W53_034000 [Senna tora]|uniref:Uncharacterized protein n=1 Tax=Senna tora TaxID=362788 RepID=A0A834SZK2_9FABA|nr:uncharacterized protein G2W53_034000 [Senna tora]
MGNSSPYPYKYSSTDQAALRELENPREIILLGS